MTQILVVDDDRGVRNALRTRLDALGYDTLEAATGIDAIEQFEATHPSVMLVDAALPDLSGFDVCRHVRALDPGGKTGVIVISGASAPSTVFVKRCADMSEADGYLRKPFNFAELRALIDTVLITTEFAEMPS